jgi:regulator of protease activity HflC (stomatin/prohibitin superfamily)
MLRDRKGLSFVALAPLVASWLMGCGSGATIQPGHRALYFDPQNGGIQKDVLNPGFVRLACPFWVPENKCPRVDDFDVTYSTAKEEMATKSSEGLALDMRIAVVYRPIVSELYLLDTEIGPNYYDEVIGPEFRSAAIGVFASTSYLDLQKKNGQIEDEIEKALRERLKGRHVEISSVLIEKLNYSPEIARSVQERVVSQEEAARKKQLLENEAAQKKRELELAAEHRKLELETASEQKKLELAAQTEQKKMELQAQAEQEKLSLTTETELKKLEIQKDTEEEKFRVESALRNKQAERKLTAEQAQIDKMKADAAAAARVSEAKGEATARLALAKASTEEHKAEAASVTPMHVMMHAYDALGHLGGSGTTIMLGDWSKVPTWLFPRVPAFQAAFNPWYMMPMPGTPNAPAAPQPQPSNESTLSRTE